MRGRIGAVLGWTVAGSAAALSAANLLPLIGLAVPAAVWPIAGTVLGVALIPLTLLVGPPGRPIVALFGIGAGVLVLVAGGAYAGAALAPSDEAARLFLVSLAGLGILVLAAFGTTRRGVGSAGGIALFASLAPLLADGAAAAAATLAGAGLLMTAGWAASVGRSAARGRRIRRVSAAPVLADSWYLPLPPAASTAASSVGIALVVAVLAAAGSASVQELDTVRQVAEAIAGLGIIVFLYTLGSAAPDLGRSRSSGIWEIVAVVLPVGRSWLAFAGAVLLALPGPIESRGRVVGPEELAGGVAMVLALSFGRLAWLLKTPGRMPGLVLAGATLAAGAIVVSRSGSAPPMELVVLGMVAAVAGLWSLALGMQLRGRAPVAVFRAPHGVRVDEARLAAAVAQAEALRTRRGATGGTRRPARPRSARAHRTDRFPRTKTPPRFDVEELARRLGVTAPELRAARPRYRELRIPKRTGGMRTLHAPDPPTLALQRRILRRLLARLPVHQSAHGFERGRSIVSNAAPHAGRAVILKLDLADFFGRTRAGRIRRYWRVLGWDKESAMLLTRLTTLDGGLPQGAPTSPRLANLVNVRLDARLGGSARALGATYTRYADDLTFSFAEDDGDRVRDLLRGARRILWHEARYEIHRAKKLQVRRQWERQLVTGLVVNQRPRLPRETRRWLRAVEHRTYTGGQPTLSREQLRGWQALESMVDQPAEDRAATA